MLSQKRAILLGRNAVPGNTLECEHAINNITSPSFLTPLIHPRSFVTVAFGALQTLSSVSSNYMLRSVIGNMLCLRVLFVFVSLLPSAFAQSYVLQDDYTIANFFNMFSFYTVSACTMRFIYVL
jgi:hypothetical protein